MHDREASDTRVLSIFPYIAGTLLAILCVLATAFNVYDSYESRRHEDILEGLLFLGAGSTFAWLVVTLGLSAEHIENRIARREAHRMSTIVNERTSQLEASERQYRTLTGKLVALMEEERSHTALAIHDGPTQGAVAAHMNLQAWHDRYSFLYVRNKDAHYGMQQALLKQQTVIKQLRTFMADLQPASLHDLGLPAAIREKIHSLHAEGWNIEFRQEPPDNNERHDPPIEQALYRVTVEALNNVRKHADAKHVSIDLREPAPDNITLVIRDDGRGFDTTIEDQRPDIAGPGERVGLKSMRERVKLLGGDIWINSAPGRGTQIKVKIPADE